MTRRTHLLPVILCLLFGSLVIGLDTEPGFAEMKAPEIALPGLEWFNVAAPLPIASLHGRVVILDFWTEGCINCIQIIPTLRRIEEQFPDQVVVIGVHSPKFANEKRAASVKDAIRRYDIRHPIVHDPEMEIWREYGVQAWPTLVVVGSDGNVAGTVAGEPDPDRFVAAIDNLVANSAKAGTLKTIAKIATQAMAAASARNVNDVLTRLRLASRSPLASYSATYLPMAVCSPKSNRLT